MLTLKKNITPKAYANDKRQQELSLFFFFFPEVRMVSPSQQLGCWTQQRAKQGTGLAWHSTSHRIWALIQAFNPNCSSSQEIN